MPRLVDTASVIRSKNAGPLTLSLDLMFRSEEAYAIAATSAALTAERLAPLYGVDPVEIEVVHYPVARAIKIALPRRIVAGSPGDSDVYGAQQHALLLGVEL